jgi:hypothetical protein
VKRLAACVGLGCALGLASPAVAHDIDVTSVARVFLDDMGSGRYLVSVVDTQAPPITDPQGVLPVRCRPLEATEVEV